MPNESASPERQDMTTTTTEGVTPTMLRAGLDELHANWIDLIKIRRIYLAMRSTDPEVTKMRRALETIANWRRDSAAYTDSMNLPRRKMDESQVIHIENEARAALSSSTGDVGGGR